MTSHPIVFFGTEDFSLIALRALVRAGFSIAGVVTKPDSKKGRGHKLTPPPIKEFALEHDIPVWQPQKLSDIADDITALDQPVGVLVSYGKIIPQRFLDLFSPGIINLHPSLLPRYRGPSPIESAIGHRDAITGVTIMQLSAKMDAGPIYSQLDHPLDGTETQASLYQTLGERGADELVRVLPAIIDGSLQPTPQNEKNASYCALLHKPDAFFDPEMMSANEIAAKVRAHLVFPKTKFHFNDMILIIKQAHADKDAKTALDIPCRDNTTLVIDSVQGSHGQTMSAEDFLRGYRA